MMGAWIAPVTCYLVGDVLDVQAFHKAFVRGETEKLPDEESWKLTARRRQILKDATRVQLVAFHCDAKRCPAWWALVRHSSGKLEEAGIDRLIIPSPLPLGQ
jgi:hypothetical protein